MMYTVYIIHSSRTRRYYTGHTEDFNRRIREHNNGENASTHSGIPWNVVYTKEYLERKIAMREEERIKKRGAGRFLESLKRNAL